MPWVFAGTWEMAQQLCASHNWQMRFYIVKALMRNPRVFESRIFDLILESFVIDLLNHVHIRYVHDRSILSLRKDFESWLASRV